MKTETQLLLQNIRFWIILFVFSLIISGLTAFPLETEMAWLIRHNSVFSEDIQQWLNKVYHALKHTNENYPFLSYGTDWLAFAHLVIATAFIGPLIDPVKNVWVIQFGMIACLMIFPLAFIAGSIRHIPFYWQLIDCSFGILGLIPLYASYRKIRRLEVQTTSKSFR